MGKIKNGILGGVSGKVGNVVGGSWKGISYLRTLPASVKDAKSIKQQSARMRLMLVVSMLQTCTDFIRLGFSGYALKMSAYNAATSYNYHNGITGEFPDYQYDYDRFLVTHGKLTGATGVTCSAENPAQVNFNWTNNSGAGNAAASDTAMILVYNPEKNRSVYLIQGVTRGDGSVILEVPTDFKGDFVYCYIGFADFSNIVGAQAKNYISDSVYAGRVKIT